MTLAELKQKAVEAQKAISTAATGVATILTVAAPDYSEPFAYGAGLVVALIGTFVTYQVPSAQQVRARNNS